MSTLRETWEKRIDDDEDKFLHQSALVGGVMKRIDSYIKVLLLCRGWNDGYEAPSVEEVIYKRVGGKDEKKSN